MKALYLLSAALVAGCSSAPPKPSLPPGAQADGTFLRLSSSAASAATKEALIAALQADCDGLCDRLYVDVDSTVSPEDLQRAVSAAAAVTPTPRVFANTSEGTVELAVNDAACEVNVNIGPDGASVLRGEELLPPDPTCERWSVAICRGDDRLYDWPRLRSEVGTPDVVCLAFETGELTELGTIERTLQKPLVRLVAPRQRDSSLDTTSMTRVIEGHFKALQWCFEGEVLEKPVPMSITLRLAVHVDGTITRSEVTDAVRTTTQFEECVRTESLKFEFAGTDEIYTAEVALEFSPDASEPTLSDITSAP